MKVRHRIRCPFCGALAWDIQWSRDYPVEAFTMGGVGRSKGIKGCFEYHPVTDPDFLNGVRSRIVLRCKGLLERFDVPKGPADPKTCEDGGCRDI